MSHITNPDLWEAAKPVKLTPERNSAYRTIMTSQQFQEGDICNIISLGNDNEVLFYFKHFNEEITDTFNLFLFS